jgi:N-acetylglutamate synthase-like GNAT family acetyltransferase
VVGYHVVMGVNMQQPRAPQAQELKEVFKFLDQNRNINDWSVADEYPLAFESKNAHNIRIITDDEKNIISHAVVKPTIIKTPYAIFQAAVIGSVMTDPRYRQQGLSSQLIENCIEQAHVLKCDFAILWTDLFDFYKTFNFELAGTELSLIINENVKPLERRQDLKILNTTQVDPQALLRLYNLHTVTSHRTSDDIKKYLHIPNSRVYTAWNKNNQLEAYAIEGKGVDLQGYIHEWGGNTSALIELFLYAQKQQNKELIVITPLHCKNLIRRCHEAGAKSYEGILAMIKLIDKASLVRKVQKTARRMGLNDFAIEMHGETLYFGTSEGVYKTDSEADIIHLLFGPQKPSEMHNFTPQTLEKLNRLLPLPLWFWGWDSI